MLVPLEKVRLGCEWKEESEEKKRTTKDKEKGVFMALDSWI